MLQLWHVGDRIVAVGELDKVIGYDDKGQPITQPLYLDMDPAAVRELIDDAEWVGDDTTAQCGKGTCRWNTTTGQVERLPPAETAGEAAARHKLEIAAECGIADIVDALALARTGDWSAVDAIVARKATIDAG